MTTNCPNLHTRVEWLERIITKKFPQTILQQRLFIVETVQGIVCDEFNIKRDYLLSDRRPQAVVWPRHIAMAISYELSGLSTLQLAPLFKRDDHATILHAVKSVRSEEKMRREKSKDVEVVRQRVNKALGKEP